MTTPPWRTRSSRTIYQNPWLRLREDLVELPSGHTTVYGVVSTGPCVGVLPFLDPDTVVLVRQYRYVAGRHTWEMPTGGVGPGERIEAAAQRELAEESGYRAGRLEPVCVYHTSKSVMDETAHLFLAFALTRAQDAPSPDETESFEVRPHRFEEVLAITASPLGGLLGGHDRPRARMAQTFHANQSDLQALGKRRWPAIPPAPWAMTASVAAWSQLWTHSSLAWPSRVGMTQTVF